MVRLPSGRTLALFSCLVSLAATSHAEQEPSAEGPSSSFPLVEAESVKAPEAETAAQPERAPEMSRSLDAEEVPAVPPPAAPAASPALTESYQAQSLTPPEPIRAIEQDPDAIFRAFSVMVDQERRRRYGGALGGVVIGGSSIALGAILKSEENINPDPFYIVGGVAIGFSILGALLPSPLEIEAKSSRVSEPGHSLDEAQRLERKWASWAEGATRRRVRASIGSMVVGGIFAGVGIAFLSGASELSDSDRALWGSLLLGSGAGMIAAGGVGLFVMSPIEASYRQYADGQPRKNQRQTVSLRLRPSGLGLAADGTF